MADYHHVATVQPSARPKVGYVEPWDRCAPPDPGGSMGLWTWEVVKRLAQSCDVLVCGPRTKNDSKQEEHNGVRFVRFPLVADTYLFRVTEWLKLAHGPRRPDSVSRFYRLLYGQRTARSLRLYGREVVHILNLLQLIPVIRRANPGSKIILHMECDWLAGLDSDFVENHLKNADLIIGCSEFITDGIRERFPQYAPRCMTVYNGVDINLFTPSPVREAGRSEKIIFANRLSPEKGLHVLIDAFERVVARRPNAVLEVAGPDTVIPLESVTSLSHNPVVSGLEPLYKSNYPEDMRSRVRGALESRIMFVGPLLHSQLAARMREADVLVQPSVFDEPFGMPIVEAMASGLPVVGSRAGGIPEIIVNGETGILVERGNPAALAEALIDLLENPWMARRMGDAGRRRAKAKFTWEHTIDGLKLCYFDASSVGNSRRG